MDPGIVRIHTHEPGHCEQLESSPSCLFRGLWRFMPWNNSRKWSHLSYLRFSTRRRIYDSLQSLYLPGIVRIHVLEPRTSNSNGTICDFLHDDGYIIEGDQCLFLRKGIKTMLLLDASATFYMMTVTYWHVNGILISSEIDVMQKVRKNDVNPFRKYI